MDPIDTASLRQSYDGPPLRKADLADDPIAQFTAWFADVVAARLPEPNAMVLATADASGAPSARTVLLKGYDEHGFVFYTNHRSRKGRDLADNPRACLVFPWHPIRRQVIVRGDVTQVSEAESAEYFHSRPRGSQLGAWASAYQSSPLDSRERLERAAAEAASSWPGEQVVPLPEFWGGYRVRPAELEFWCGRADRLHDRFRYARTADGWALERLSP